MVTGLKATSALVSIGFQVTEPAINTFTETQIDLNLSPLDREVFVVLSANMDLAFPDNTAGASSRVTGSLSTTRQLALPSLADANCFAVKNESIRGNALNAVSFSSGGNETSPTNQEFLTIIATNDFFAQVQGVGNVNPKVLSGKVYGYRARASADIFAALVQSEVLSA